MGAIENAYGLFGRPGSTISMTRVRQRFTGYSESEITEALSRLRKRRDVTVSEDNRFITFRDVD